MSRGSLATGASALCGVIGFVFVLVAVCTNFWVQDHVGNFGLWTRCDHNVASHEHDCNNLYIGQDIKYKNFEMVRGFGVLATIMCFMGCVCSTLGLTSLVKIQPTVPATAYLMAAFFGLTAVGLFTSIADKIENRDFNYGYSYGLGWTAFPFTLLAGGIMTYVDLKA